MMAHFMRYKLTGRRGEPMSAGRLYDKITDKVNDKV